MRFQHLFLAPTVILTIPEVAVYNQKIPVVLLTLTVGISGMLWRKKTLATAASVSLLALLVWGKAASTILKTSSPDTALLLVEFTAVLVLLESSSAVLSFDADYSKLRGREDDLSKALHGRLQAWLQTQLVNQGRLGLSALGLAVALLPLAGITSIRIDQLFLTATLALLAVLALLFLVTHRREPENP